jgi:hypothetical protein
MRKTILMPIKVPVGDYCGDKVKKPQECLNFKNQEEN